MELRADNRDTAKKIHRGQLLRKSWRQNDRSAFFIIHGITMTTETESAISLMASEKLRLNTKRHRKKIKTDSYRDDNTSWENDWILESGDWKTFGTLPDSVKWSVLVLIISKTGNLHYIILPVIFNQEIRLKPKKWKDSPLFKIPLFSLSRSKHHSPGPPRLYQKVLEDQSKNHWKNDCNKLWIQFITRHKTDRTGNRFLIKEIWYDQYHLFPDAQSENWME